MELETDLLVIGAGYWGTGVTLKALERGVKVITLDDNDKESGSRNASAVCDPRAYDSEIFAKYFPYDWTKKDLEESLEWLLGKGAYIVKEYFWNKYQGSSPRLMPREIFYLETPQYLTSQITPLNGKVVSIFQRRNLSKKTSEGWTIVYETIDKLTCQVVQNLITCKKLVIACGYRTDDVVELISPNLKLGVGKLYGRGINAKGTPNTSLPVSIMIKPYVKHTVRAWKNGIFKIGDTCEKKISDTKFNNLEAVGREALDNFEIVEVTAGWRPTLPKFTVAKLLENLVVATGGHRLGLGVTGLVASKVLKELKYDR